MKPIQMQLKFTKSEIIVNAAVLALVLIAAGVIYLQNQPNIQEVSALLSGSGATFPQPQINAWVQKFSAAYPKIRIEYAGGGSGKGQTDFLSGIVDFAGSDVPLASDKWAAATEKYGKVYQLPWLVGGIAIVYNIPELGGKQLRLSQEALVKILLGQIEYWDDPMLKSLNPGLSLPHQKIIFVHRSDASGTNAVFTTFLSKISGEWKSKVGAGLTVNWPLDAQGRGIGGQGNPGVAQAVKSTPYSMGYVELAYTKGLQVALLENAVGEYVAPTPESVSKAAGGVSISYDPSADVSKYDLLSQMLNVRASGAYPIVTPTYVIVKAPDKYPREKALALGLFLKWVFTEGQKPGNIIEGYAPISGPFVDAGLKVANELLGRK
ncbi:MAG: phosphate ABC transporter substrate-binding protein PstS [Infirmifilum sp.]